MRSVGTGGGNYATIHRSEAVAGSGLTSESEGTTCKDKSHIIRLAEVMDWKDYDRT